MSMEIINNNTNQVETEDEIDVLDLFKALFQKAYIVIAAAVLGAVLFGAYTFFLVTPEYTASSEIYIYNLKNSISLSDIQLGNQIANDFVIIGESRPVMEQVIGELNLDTTPKKLSEKVSVTSLDSSRVLKITAKDYNPELASDICNAVSNAIRDRIAEVMATDRPSVVESAIPPVTPTGYSPVRNVVLGFAIGFVVSAIIIIVCHIVDDSIKVSDDVEKYLGINVLASIPEEYIGKKPRTSKRRKSA